MSEDFKQNPNIIEIPKGATRREIHKMIFGIDPPELDTPMFDCMRDKGCENCKHRNNINCDKVWWDSPWEKN